MITAAATSPLTDLLSASQVAAHVSSTHSLAISGATRLDANVFSVGVVPDTGEGDGKSTALVARIFAAHHEPGIRSLADLLRHLRHLDPRLPVEALAEPAVTRANAVAEQEHSGIHQERGQGESQPRRGEDEVCVLTTVFAPGKHPERNKATFFRIGRLLGRLHALRLDSDVASASSGTILRRGGAWHHLSMEGDIAEECTAAESLLREFQDRHRGDTAQDLHASENSAFAAILAELDMLRTALGTEVLPKCIVHPDLVPVNIIEDAAQPPAGYSSSNDVPSPPRWTVVDWTGAGVGCRVAPLGFVLGVAGAKGRTGLVDAVMKAYAEFVTITDEEMHVLPLAVYARFFTIECWKVAHSGLRPEKLVEGLGNLKELGERVARRVRELRLSG